MRKTKSRSLSPNLAAKSLALGRFQAKTVQSKKVYTRKTKHKKGSSILAAPFFVAQTPNMLPLLTD